MVRAPWLTSEFLRRLEALELTVRSVRAGSRLGGRFLVNRRGSSIEFADYIPYTSGDDIRAIDWNLYARLDKLYIKTYREEITLAVEIFMDATRSMGLPSAQKITLAQRLAFCLAYVAVTDRHHVRVTPIAPGRPAATPWWTRPAHVLEALDRPPLSARGHVRLAEWMRQTVLGQRIRGGQAIVITDGMTRPADLFSALHLLSVRHVEPKLIQVLTPQELHPGDAFRRGIVVDAETGQAQQLAYSSAELARAVSRHNELIARFCKRHGIPFAQYRTDQPLESFVTDTLPLRGFLQ